MTKKAFEDDESKNKIHLIRTIAGTIWGCFTGDMIGSLILVNSAPSISDVRNTVANHITLTELEKFQVAK
jgi:hypothetical protein